MSSTEAGTAATVDRRVGPNLVPEHTRDAPVVAERIFGVMGSTGHLLVVGERGAGEDPVQRLMDLTDGKGYDDVFVIAPVAPVIEQGDRILGFDGCLNFFAGPTNPNLSAMFNFYDVHYNSHHIVGTSGGNAALPGGLRVGINVFAPNP